MQPAAGATTASGIPLNRHAPGGSCPGSSARLCLFPEYWL